MCTVSSPPPPKAQKTDTRKLVNPWLKSGSLGQGGLSALTTSGGGKITPAGRPGSVNTGLQIGG